MLFRSPQKRATLIILRNPIFKRQTAVLILMKKQRADNCDFSLDYRLCVFASGSLIIDIFNFRIVIIVSCLHFGQNSGKFSSNVSSRILRWVLLSQTGHNIHFSSIIVHHPLSCSFFIFAFSFIIDCFDFIEDICAYHMF